MAGIFDPDTQLAGLRKVVLQFMPESAQVLRSTSEPDGEGGQTGTESVIATVPCSRSALTGRDLATAAALSASSTYKVTVPYGTNVTSGDAFVVGGVRYEVDLVPDNSYAAQISCLCSVAG
ncbi:phage head closure protein [uncultured Friedmanniella sp.]|uniref:phage head closure protein n=1 Tax=uncultured Friedmanniella sp. TaxID=335381 RepID=UPI0035CB789F